MKNLGTHLGVTFIEAKRPDIERLVSWLTDQDCTPHPVSDYALALMRFYKFVRFGSVDPENTFANSSFQRRRGDLGPTFSRFFGESDSSAGSTQNLTRKKRNSVINSVHAERGSPDGKEISSKIGETIEEPAEFIGAKKVIYKDHISPEWKAIVA